MFPVAVCVALRKLIVSNRDAGRPLDTKFGSHSLRGLRLERNSRLEIYHGFGYLWHFCETAKNQIQPQINWFIVGASYLFDPITFHVLTYWLRPDALPSPNAWTCCKSGSPWECSWKRAGCEGCIGKLSLSANYYFKRSFSLAFRPKISFIEGCIARITAIFGVIGFSTWMLRVCVPHV